ncbi:MAG: hypothetical protein IH946_06175 [Bacteroidetes bacterium]|nr:hypothetical protein [Bacteroidota bacterium]
MTLPARDCANPHCSDKFHPSDGRQLYCTSGCQIWFNNYKARQLRQKIRPIASGLNRNRRILFRILGEEAERTVSRDYLLGAEYDFNIYTRAFKDEKERVHYFVYDIGLVEQGQTNYKIFRYDAALTST